MHTQHMRADPLTEAVMNSGARAGSTRFQAPEGTLDRGQAFVGADCGAGIEFGLGHRGADDVDAVEACLLGDGVGSCVRSRTWSW